MSAQRLRVVHLIDQLNPGGAERFTMNVVARLDPERFERTIVETRATRDWYPGDERAATLDWLTHEGVHVVELGRRGRFDFAAWRPFLAMLRRERIQILHAHMFGSAAWGTAAARLTGVPIMIAHEHGSPPQLSRVRLTVERTLLARGVDLYLTVSEVERRALIEGRGIPEAMTHVLANGITTAEVDPSRDVRAEFGIAPDAPLVTSVGVQRTEKAFADLIRAIAIAAPQIPGLRLLLIGDGVERPALEALVDELGLREAVCFADFRTDVPDLLAAADIAVNSSLREGSPLSVMEYMEAGLPVVATAVGSVPEIVEDGRTGVLVPPRDPDAIAAGLVRVLTDPDLARSMGERGRARRREHYDLDGVARRLGDLYEELWRRRG